MDDSSYLIDAQVITDNGNHMEVYEIHEQLHAEADLGGVQRGPLPPP